MLIQRTLGTITRKGLSNQFRFVVGRGNAPDVLLPVRLGAQQGAAGFSTTTPVDDTKYYALVSDKDNTLVESKEGGHIGGTPVRGGMSTSRKGRVYPSGNFFSCCGAKQDGQDESSSLLYSYTPCTRGKDDMYHPGELVTISVGIRRNGWGTGGGYLHWSCCQEEETLPASHKEIPPKGCTPIPSCLEEEGEEEEEEDDDDE